MDSFIKSSAVGQVFTTHSGTTLLELNLALVDGCVNTGNSLQSLSITNQSLNWSLIIILVLMPFGALLPTSVKA